MFKFSFIVYITLFICEIVLFVISWCIVLWSEPVSPLASSVM